MMTSIEFNKGLPSYSRH